MPCTGPPGNPWPLPQRSRRYCDTSRPGSSAAMGAHRHTTVASAAKHARRASPARTPLRQVLELLNDDLDITARCFGCVSEVVQVHAHSFGSWNGNAGGELVLGHGLCLCRGARAAHASERRAARLPSKTVCDRTGWRHEADDIGGDVVRLYDELRVADRPIAPLTELDIQLTVILIGALLVPRQQTHGRGRIETRRVADDERVGAIAERSRVDDL